MSENKLVSVRLIYEDGTEIDLKNYILIGSSNNVRYKLVNLDDIKQELIRLYMMFNELNKELSEKLL
jgi:hypothetical protein